MKKILLTTIILILTSCTSDSVQISKEEYNRLKGINPTKVKPFKLYTEGLKYHQDGIVPGSDKHEYLITNFSSNQQGTEHYIDCEYCLKRNKKK